MAATFEGSLILGLCYLLMFCGIVLIPVLVLVSEKLGWGSLLPESPMFPELGGLLGHSELLCCQYGCLCCLCPWQLILLNLYIIIVSTLCVYLMMSTILCYHKCLCTNPDIGVVFLFIDVGIFVKQEVLHQKYLKIFCDNIMIIRTLNNM